MISIRSCLTRNALYLLSAFLFTIITLQISITPQLGANGEDNDLPVPLPHVDVYACVGWCDGTVYVVSQLLNTDYILGRHIGWVFSGRAVGEIKNVPLVSQIAVQENGQTVMKTVRYKPIFIEIVSGANTASTGVHGEIGGEGGSVGVSHEQGSETSTPKIRNKACVYGYRTFWPESGNTAWGDAELEGEGYSDWDSSAAVYSSYMIIGFSACDNVTS